MLLYLARAVRWHGPIFLEVVRLEERAGDCRRALAMAAAGLAEAPKYGPLLFKVRARVSVSVVWCGCVRVRVRVLVLNTHHKSLPNDLLPAGLAIT